MNFNRLDNNYDNYRTSQSQINGSMMLGFVLSFLIIFLGVVIQGNFINFISISGILIVLGGVFAAMLINFSFSDIKKTLHSINSVLYSSNTDARVRMDELVNLSYASRKKGLLVLEDVAEETKDPFFKKALRLVVDGQQENDIKKILETEMNITSEENQKGIAVFETMGSYAPAMGLIGTLLGLVNMLGSLDDPSKVGPAMSVALLTTFYGAVLANMVFIPLAGKIKNIDASEILLRKITIEGILSLARQQSPLIIEQRLQSFMPAA